MSRDSIIKKSTSILYFLEVLEASYKVEIGENRSKLYDFLKEENLEPDFKLIRELLVRSKQKLLRHMRTNGARSDLKSEANQIETTSQKDINDLIPFFREYFESGILLEG